MNAIIGMTNIGKAARDIDRKNYCFNRIDNASNHLLGVINDILDMSKIEADKFELSYSEFSLEKMLMRVTNVVDFRMGEKAQRLFVRMEPDIPRVILADEQRLAQVITNLLSNAMKFTPEGGDISVHISKLEEENDICTLRIEVIDTGIGISPEQQSRLFRSFEQADSSTSRQFGGTGLGLAISKRIVEMMDGKIWIESELGQGASFIFTIRVQICEDHETVLCESIDSIHTLVVDDSKDLREYFLLLAKQIGFDCDAAASGDEALEMISRPGADYNLFFIDWYMPGMDGIELTRRIREKGDTQSIITMISATEWAKIEEEAKAAGVNRFLPKPLFPSAIADCVNELTAGVFDNEDSGLINQSGEAIRGMHLLLVDDIEINREIVQVLLEPWDVLVECAENGKIAVDMFREKGDEYDMIFMDVHMPEMDGYEATRHIRAIDDMPWAKVVPIIAMTANVFREDIEKCLAAGMNDHVGKPLDIDIVMEKMATLGRKPEVTN
jgi:CheY-like chemotaxis protein/two-component sensor histidine kinase